MKRKLCKLLLASIIIAVFICTSCKNDVQKSVPQLFEDNPATITWDSSKTDFVDTFSAMVSVYEDSNRRTGGAKLFEQYKMSVKTVADKQYIRLDFPAKEKITAKSVLTNGTDTIIDDSAFKLIMEL